MKIRHFLLYGSLDPRFGGPTYSVPIQCIGVQDRGADVSFVVYEASKPYEGRLVAAGVEMVYLKNRRRGNSPWIAPSATNQIS